MEKLSAEYFINFTADKWVAAQDLSPFAPRDELIDDIGLISRNQEYLVRFLEYFFHKDQIKKYRSSLISGPIEDFINTVTFDEFSLANRIKHYPDICEMFVEAWADEGVEARLKSALGQYCRSSDRKHSGR